jgi:hypothetical protein
MRHAAPTQCHLGLAENAKETPSNPIEGKIGDNRER